MVLLWPKPFWNGEISDESLDYLQSFRKSRPFPLKIGLALRKLERFRSKMFLNLKIWTGSRQTLIDFGNSQTDSAKIRSISLNIDPVFLGTGPDLGKAELFLLNQDFLYDSRTGFDRKNILLAESGPVSAGIDPDPRKVGPIFWKVY